jgi:hypothetical protein
MCLTERNFLSSCPHSERRTGMMDLLTGFWIMTSAGGKDEAEMI